MRIGKFFIKTMKQEYIKFDVMLKGRFVCTLRLPLSFDIIDSYDGDKPVVDYSVFERFVEQKRPTLKGKPYEIYF